MNKDIKGPVVFTAYNSQRRAVAIKNHICVSSVHRINNSITVYREKLFTVSENSSIITTEIFPIKQYSTASIKEMLDFIKYHFEIALSNHSLTEDEISNHKTAIEILEIEIEMRQDIENVTFKFLLTNLIKEKELEIELLKRKLHNLDKN